MYEDTEQQQQHEHHCSEIQLVQKGDQSIEQVAEFSKTIFYSLRNTHFLHTRVSNILMSTGGEGNIGAGTSESASAGCSLSERLRPSQQHQKHNLFARRTLPDLDGLAVFTWGRGEDGQLGLGDTSDQDEPTYVDALRGVGVRQIACGSGHTVVLTSDGEV